MESISESSNKTEVATKSNRIIRNRKLVEEDVFQHNAWDDVEWDEEQLLKAQEAIEKNSQLMASEQQRETLEVEAPEFWDKFYSVHSNRFFKDRNWLYSEFSEIYELPQEEVTAQELTRHLEAALPSPHVSPDSTAAADTCCKRMLEVGCGVGNTVFPVLETTKEEIFVYCCDFSPLAVQLVKDHPMYNPRTCHAFVCDITEMEDVPFEKNSLDVITMIFVLSAISPEKMQNAVTSLASYLRPGGYILFRDYGRYDLAQLRFKPGRCLADNFYARGDGTRVYFFTLEEVDQLFTRAKLEKVQNMWDRRLQVNRGKQLKMYRVWVQAKYRKPLHPS